MPLHRSKTLVFHTSGAPRNLKHPSNGVVNQSNAEIGDVSMRLSYSA
jgi:hypothetical protein